MSMFNLVVTALLVATALLFAGVWAFQNYGIYRFGGDDDGRPADDVKTVKFRSSDGQVIGARLAIPSRASR